MKQLLRKHIWAIVFAIFMGGVIIVPHIWFRIEHADIFKGIGFGGSDEAAYMTRIQEVKDGHWSTANYVWKEGKDKPYLLPPLSEMIVVGLGKVIGTNTLDTVTAGRFLFPAINFLLIYALVYLITKRRLIALIAGATIMMSLDMFDPSNLKNLLLGKKLLWRNFLPYNRLVSPQVHLIFFYGFLILFWYFYDRKKAIFSISSGIVLGLSFYTYPFTWSWLFWVCHFIHIPLPGRFCLLSWQSLV